MIALELIYFSEYWEINKKNKVCYCLIRLKSIYCKLKLNAISELD